MEFLSEIISYFLHLDQHLGSLVENYGTLTYLVLFLIIFCETGLVVTPILPGDSLLFAAGATVAASGVLNIHALAGLLILAAILGDGANYMIGSYLGVQAFIRYPRIFRPAYLEKTRSFYERYGGKTIIFARFIPIVRTFAPFLAGVGKMRYSYFVTYNIVGGIIWIAMFLYGGYFFANIPAVKKNFTLVILGIIVVSVLPALFEYVKAKRTASEA